jgi:hypothetical protein
MRSSSIGRLGSSRPLDDQPDDTSISDLVRFKSVRTKASGRVPLYDLPVILSSEMRLHLLVAAILSCIGTAAIAAEDTAPESPKAVQEPVPKPAPRARWSEDWSTLRDITPLEDAPPPTGYRFLQPIKYIPLNKSGDAYLSLGGEYRLAYELYDKVDMGISNIRRQDALQNRVALHADLHLSPRWRVFAQLGYASVHDRDGGAKTIDETNPDLWQLFADYRIPLQDDERFVLRLGRQMIETANVFITAGEAHNIRLVYNGGRVAWVTEDFVPFEAFGAEYVDYDNGTFDMSGDDEYFWGFRGGVRLEEIQSSLHFLYLGWDLDDRQFEQGGAGRHDELRHTVMLWFNRPLTGNRQWGLDYYLAYQFGDYDDANNSNISAFAAFGEVKYAIFQEAYSPMIGLKTSYFSGDQDPDDGELNTFYDHVFGTPYFSYARDIMPFNLIHIQPRIGYRFGERLLLTLNYDLLWRAERDDAYYNSANGILVRADGSNSRWLGQQTQLAAHYKPMDQITINVYWAHLFAGDVIEDAGGDDRDYFHIGLNLLF